MDTRLSSFGWRTSTVAAAGVYVHSTSMAGSLRSMDSRLPRLAQANSPRFDLLIATVPRPSGGDSARTGRTAAPERRFEDHRVDFHRSRRWPAMDRWWPPVGRSAMATNGA